MFQFINKGEKVKTNEDEGQNFKSQSSSRLSELIISIDVEVKM